MLCVFNNKWIGGGGGGGSGDCDDDDEFYIIRLTGAPLRVVCKIAGHRQPDTFNTCRTRARTYKRILYIVGYLYTPYDYM